MDTETDYFIWFPIGYHLNDKCENSHDSCTTCWSCSFMLPGVWCDLFTIIPRGLLFLSIIGCKVCYNGCYKKKLIDSQPL